MPVTDWDRIVRENGPMVYGTAWRILGHAADAEDVVQDVFLELHRQGDKLQGVNHWPAFLRKHTAFRALDRLRQRKDTVPCDGLALASSCDGPEAVAMGRELADRLRQAIAQLPEREGAVFCLRYFEDLSYDRIAKSLDVSRGAVATALHKARAKLESMLLEVVKGE